jgi:hypothetical protein
MAASMRMAVFWVVAPCSLVEVYQRFRGACCLIALMMDAVNTSETSVNFYQVGFEVLTAVSMKIAVFYQTEDGCLLGCDIL